MAVMVMDVEGTDGRERGEDQVGFASDVSPLVIKDLYLRTLNANQHYSH